MSDMFDPDSFLNSVTTEANSTSAMPVPAGEYFATVKELKMRQWKGKEDPTKGGLILDVVWSIDDAGVKQAMDRQEVLCRQALMLDLVEGTSNLDTGKGKNVGLGRLREALDLNTPGQPFTPSQMVGRAAKVKVEHRVDPKDSSKIYDEVKAAAKLA